MSSKKRYSNEQLTLFRKGKVLSFREGCFVEVSESDRDEIIKQLQLYVETFSQDPTEFVNANEYADQLIDRGGNSYLLVYSEESEQLGGLIFDYFEKSECGLISYVWVKDAYAHDRRNAGLGEFLMTEALDELVRSEFSKDNLKALFLETEDPHFAEESSPDNLNDSQTYRNDLVTIQKRLNFFREKVGARHVDIPYVQPPVDFDERPESDTSCSFPVLGQLKNSEEDQNHAWRGTYEPSLYLFVLPRYSKTSFGVAMEYGMVMEFLLEYNLSVSEKEHKEDLKTFLKLEDPTFSKLSHSSLCQKVLGKFDRMWQFEENPGKEQFTQVKRKYDDAGFAPWLKHLFWAYLSLVSLDLLEDVDPAREGREHGKPISSLHEEIIESYRHSKGSDSSLYTIREEVFNSFCSSTRVREAIKCPTDKMFYLNQVPAIVDPRLSFPKAAVAFQIANSSVPKSGASKPGDIAEKDFCPFFNSFEQDLLSVSFQDANAGKGASPPATVCFGYGECSIEFKNKLEFISEGRHETYFLGDYFMKRNGRSEFTGRGKYEKRLRFNISKTFFAGSGIKVWNFVLSPTENGTFTDFELLQLSKHVNGYQEKFRYACDGKVLSAEGETGVRELAENALKLLAGTYPEKNDGDYLSIESGVIQVDLEFAEWIDPAAPSDGQDQAKTFTGFTEGTIEDLDNAISSATDAGLEAADKGLKVLQGIKSELADSGGLGEYLLQEFIRNNESSGVSYDIGLMRSCEHSKRINYAACFFALLSTALLDQRMKFDEVSDSVKPRYGATSEVMQVMDKKLLVYFTVADDILGNMSDSIGINPYAILPSIVLANNSFVLRSFGQNDLSAAAKDSRRSLYDAYNQTEEEIKELEELLVSKVVANVFHYDTECDVFSFGMKHRGLERQIQEFRERKVNLIDQLNRLAARKQDLFNLGIVLIGLFLTVIEIYVFARDRTLLNSSIVMIREYIEQVTGFQLSGVGSLIFAFLLVAVLGIIYYLKRKGTFEK